MISGGVSYDGDPAKAKAALVEAIHCANIVRGMKSRMGLRALTKQFDLQGGGVVWITDNEFNHHIYIDVRDERERRAAEEAEDKTLYSINPAVLFVSANSPDGILPASPPDPATPNLRNNVKSGSLWKNPPFATGKELKFAHGKYRLYDSTEYAGAFPGVVDWSDRRPTATADFPGIVLSWWGAGGLGRYTVQSYIEWRAGSPANLLNASFGQEGASGASSIVWANGVPIADVGLSVIFACLTKELVGGVKKSFMWVAGSGNFNAIELKKFKAPARIRANTPMLTPADVVESKQIEFTSPAGDPPPVGTYANTFVQSSTAKPNSSGTKFIVSIGELYTNIPNGLNGTFADTCVKVVEVTIADGTKTVLKAFPLQRPFMKDGAYVPVTSTRPAYTEPAPASYYARQDYQPGDQVPTTHSTLVVSNGSSSVSVSGRIAEHPLFTWTDEEYFLYAVDYEQNTPVFLYGDLKTNRSYSHKVELGSSSTATASGGGFKTIDYYYVGPLTGSFYYTYSNWNMTTNRTATVTWTDERQSDRTSTFLLRLNKGGVETTLFTDVVSSVDQRSLPGTHTSTATSSFLITGSDFSASVQDQSSDSWTYNTTINGQITNTQRFPQYTLSATDLRVGLVSLDIILEEQLNSGTDVYSGQHTQSEQRISYNYVPGTPLTTFNASSTRTVSGGGSTTYSFQRFSTNSDLAAATRTVRSDLGGAPSITNWSVSSYVPNTTPELRKIVVPWDIKIYPLFYQNSANYVFVDPVYASVLNGISSPPPPSNFPQLVISKTGYNVYADDTTVYLDAAFPGAATSSFDNKLGFAWALTPKAGDLVDQYDIVPGDVTLTSRLFTAAGPYVSIDLTNSAYHPNGLTGELKGATQFLFLGPIEDDNGSLLSPPTTLKKD